MNLLQDFVDVIRNGSTPHPEAMDAAAEAIGDMLAFSDYHRRKKLGVAEDMGEAHDRNIDAAHDLVRRVIDTLKHPIVHNEHYTVLVGGHELSWLQSILTHALETDAKEIPLIPKRPQGGRPRRNFRKKLETYAATLRDVGVPERQAIHAITKHAELLGNPIDIEKMRPESREENLRDYFRKELVPNGRKKLERRSNLLNGES